MRKDFDILVVDDEKELCRVLYYGLGNRPYKVSTATTGNEALIKVKKHPPKLVVLDMKLPDMDGLEVLRSIKEINPEITVVILTAYGTQELRKEARALGAHDFLSKPFKISEVWQVVQQTLGAGDHSAKPMENDNLILSPEGRGQGEGVS